MAFAKKDIKIKIPESNIQRAILTIKSDSPLIYHKWSEKAKEMMRVKQQKLATKGRETRDPIDDYSNTPYINQSGELCVRGAWFKEAIVAATRNIEGVTMTLIRGAMFITTDQSDLIPVYSIMGKKKVAIVPTSGATSSSKKRLKVTLFDPDDRPEGLFGFDPKHPKNILMREDMVRVGMGSADLRYRLQLNDWLCDLEIRFNADVISLEQIANLINIAGFACGVGEQRPERGGNNGTFSVAQ